MSRRPGRCRRGRLAPFLLATLLLAPTAGPALAYEEAPVIDGGVLTGRVRFAGEPPKAEPIPVRKNLEVCGERAPGQALLVGPDRGVRNTVVYLEGVERGRKPADFELDNARCLFVPHVSAVMLGGKARIKNSDPVLHNTHGLLDRLTVFNIALPNRGQVVPITQRIRKPGVIDVHSHLGNYPSPGVDAHSDGNEATNPVRPEVWAEHSVWPQDPGFSRALANGGVTTLQILPGSANLFHRATSTAGR